MPIPSDLIVKTSGPTIKQVIKHYSNMHVSEYTKHVYDSNGKLLDDGLGLDVEKSYFDSFIDSRQARELNSTLEEQERKDDEGFWQDRD